MKPKKVSTVRRDFTQLHIWELSATSVVLRPLDRCRRQRTGRVCAMSTADPTSDSGHGRGNLADELACTSNAEKMCNLSLSSDEKHLSPPFTRVLLSRKSHRRRQDHDDGRRNRQDSPGQGGRVLRSLTATTASVRFDTFNALMVAGIVPGVERQPVEEARGDLAQGFG
jgi:hypothetical protein